MPPAIDRTPGWIPSNVHAATTIVHYQYYDKKKKNKNKQNKKTSKCFSHLIVDESESVIGLVAVRKRGVPLERVEPTWWQVEIIEEAGADLTKAIHASRITLELHQRTESAYSLAKISD